MLKLFITSYKKCTQYGDMHWINEHETYCPFEGKKILVKLFGLIWITYFRVDYHIN